VLISPDVNSEVVDDLLGEAHAQAPWWMHSWQSRSPAYHESSPSS
jgi:hypothetical protein